MSTSWITEIPSEWLFSFFGGCLIGLSSVLFLLFHGRIAGISGILTKIMDSALFPTNPKRLATCSQFGFFIGLLGSGIYWNSKYITHKTNFQPFQEVHYSSYILAVSGFLVGFGTRLGCGCTSGHGVCGLARRSMRSLTAVLSFFTFGVIASTLSNIYIPELYHIGNNNSDAYNSQIVISLLCAALLCGAIYSGSKSIANERRALIPSICIGFAFGTGLIYSGMTKPDKVRAFLNWNTHNFTQHFDPSLAFVFMGALIITVPLFPFITRNITKPFFCPMWHVSCKTVIDRRLVIGSAIFGTGWGLAGICPGPGFVSLTATEYVLPFYIWCIAFAVGNRLHMLL